MLIAGFLVSDIFRAYLTGTVPLYLLDFRAVDINTKARFVFEYIDTEISPARYASMINYFLLEGGGNYYIYNWY